MMLHTNISSTGLPSSDSSISLSFSVTYVQADNNAIEDTNVIYTVSSNPFTIGEAIPNEKYYSNLDANSSEIGVPIFIKHIIKNDLINKSYIGYAILNQYEQMDEYYLQGGGASYNINEDDYNGDSPYYDNNKEILNSLFGTSNCHESTSGSKNSYYCSINGIYFIEGNTISDGSVHICQQKYSSDDIICCFVSSDGLSKCELAG